MTHPEDGRTDPPAADRDAAETAELGTGVPSTAEPLPAAGPPPPREDATAALPVSRDAQADPAPESTVAGGPDEAAPTPSGDGPGDGGPTDGAEPPASAAVAPAPATPDDRVPDAATPQPPPGEDIAPTAPADRPADAALPEPEPTTPADTTGADVQEPAAAAAPVSLPPQDTPDEHPAPPTGAGPQVPQDARPTDAQPTGAQPTGAQPTGAHPTRAPADGSSDAAPAEHVPEAAHRPSGSVAAGSTAGAATAASALADPHAHDEGAPATGVEPETAAPARRAGLPVVLAAVLALLLLAGVAFLGWSLRQQQLTETARDEATSASREAARLLFSYDHAKLDEDFAKGLATTTGSFTDEYSRTTKEVVAPVAKEYKAVVVADVVESAVIEAEPDEVTALVFLNQATTSTRVTGQQVDQSRVRMTLVKRGDAWLVSEVKAL